METLWIGLGRIGLLILYSVALASSFIKKERKSLILQQLIILLYTLLGFSIVYYNGEAGSSPFIQWGMIYGVIITVLFWGIHFRLSRRGIRLMNLCVLLMSTGLIMLARLNSDLMNLQVRNIAIGLGMLFLSIPMFQMLRNWKYRMLHLGYAICGFILLCLPFIFGESTLGALNWVTFANINFQPSEIIKLLLIIMLAYLYRKEKSFKNFCLGSIMSATYVFILVIQKDLGGALIYTMIYMFMTYIYIEWDIFLLGGFAFFSGCGYIAYQIFNHVQVRVEAWLNPWESIQTSGYQIAQALFAISEGGWFGVGLTKGMPGVIPIVTSDFIFAAICEEMGILLGILLIATYVLIHHTITKNNQAFKQYDRLLLNGVSISIIFQTFLIIGGVIKLVPLSGVTLPLVSYGGSSLFVTMLMVGLVQCILLKGEKSDDKKTKRQKSNRKAKTRKKK